MKSIRLIVACALLAWFHSAAGQGPAAGTWQWQIRAGAIHRIDADLDSGGELGVNRAFADISAARRVGDTTRLGVSLGYGEDRYEFSGNAGIATLDPWERVRNVSLGASVFHQLDDRWTAYFIPSLRFNAETGADLDDGRTFGLLAGASYKFSDSLTLGPGFGVFEEIEDDASLFPVLIVDWKINEQLTLETGRGFAASRGPGLQLRWRPAGPWEVAAGARYESRRFRLDTQGTAPGGVGEDQAVPVFLAAQYSMSPDFSFSLIGGAETAATVRLENANGTLLSESDGDVAPFIGASLRLRL